LIDCHCHLLHGIDDGPDTLDDAIAMARTLVQFGFVEVHCTPHCIRGLYENTPVIVNERLDLLQKALEQAAIPLLLRPGMEYYLDSRFSDCLDKPQTLGKSRLLLVEAPTWAGADLIIDNIQKVVNHGYVPLMAHPERCNLFPVLRSSSGMLAKTRNLLGLGAAEPATDLLQQLQRCGCLFQGNLGSFAGRYGRLVKKRAESFLDAGIFSCLGSDSHPLPGLEEMIADGLEQVHRLANDPRKLLSARNLLS
jgi:protein-tyrosine phosphatase